MREKKAKKILESVKNTFNAIGEEFDQTRKEPVREFNLYRKYLTTSTRIADIGCGNGRLLASLKSDNQTKKYNYIGIDNSEKMIALASKAYPTEHFVKGDLMAIPLPNNSQDIVFVIRAFHHLPNSAMRKKSLFELNRILKPQGTLIITVWNLWQKKFIITFFKSILRCIITIGEYNWNDFFIPWNKKHHRYYHAFTPSELANLITKSGFEIIENFFVNKDKKVHFKKANDIVIVAKKTSNIT